MEINNITSAGQNPASIGSLDTAMEKADFMKLLIAQLCNQDPLAPMENQDFAAQLAQFSSLEQLSSIDNNIKQGVEMDFILTQAINNTLAATVIGQDVKAVGDTVVFSSDGSADIPFRLDRFADDVEVTITDSAGNIVRTLSAKSYSEGYQTMDWDGKNEHGDTVPEDTYHFSVKATSASGNSISVMPIIMGTVSSVRYENGMAILVVGGEEVSFSSVLEIGMLNEG
ncbi:MAG: flagellar hook capping FlgD N-terminal domain-containing protein [Candidatus Hatepunaea meridiana]|nr:flagellar hook capping FlgD N-terminal domain-containing protein [Candidatus Hatepunaea meridiana]